nr:PAS domain S-box protein [Acidobacteriota bacterium]
MHSGADDYLMKDSLARLVPAIERGVQEAENRRARRLAEEALRESEDRYRDLVEHSHDLICTHDMEGRILSVNRTAARALGYAPEELLGRDLRDALAPEFRGRFDEYIAEIRKEGIARGQMVVRTRAGERRVWEYTNTLRTEGVATPIVRGVAHDVTERIRAEQAVRESEKELCAIFEAMTDVIIVLDREGRYLKIAATRADLLYRPPTSLVGKTMHEVFPAEQADFFLAHVRRALEEGEMHKVEYSLTIEGAEVWFEGSVSPMSERAVVWVAHDITGRKRSQERLETSEGRFRQMAENINEVFWLVDPNEGAMLYVSPAYEEIWGRTCRSLYERPASYVEFVHPEDRVRVTDASQRQRRGERTEDEYRIVRPDGSVRWIHDRAFPIKGESGGVSRIVGIAEDITERKQLEEQLRQSQKMEAVGRLAGGIAHDFNNLLTAINGYSDLALRRLQAEDPLRKSVEEIRKAGERAAALTRQLLAFSRKQVLQPVVLDLNSVVSDMEKMLRRLIGEDVELRTALAHDLGSIKADPGQVEQVIMNLAVNARDAMPSGGRLTIETANVYLGEEYAARRLTDFTPGPYVVLTVTDTGTGMDDETRERIFEPFFTTKGSGKGTGLGLSTVYGIVRQSGGSVRVSSEVGRGSTFEVYFPRAGEGVQEYRRGAEPEEVLRGAETVLLAEDEEMVRRLAREVLEVYG